MWLSQFGGTPKARAEFAKDLPVRLGEAERLGIEADYFELDPDQRRELLLARAEAAGLTAAPQIEADFEQQVWRHVAERRDGEARMAEWLTLDEAVELVREQIAEMKVESDRELVERCEELLDRLMAKGLTLLVLRHELGTS